MLHKMEHTRIAHGTTIGLSVGLWPTGSYSSNDFWTPKGSVRTSWELRGHFKGVTHVTKDLEFFFEILDF